MNTHSSKETDTLKKHKYRKRGREVEDKKELIQIEKVARNRQKQPPILSHRYKHQHPHTNTGWQMQKHTDDHKNTWTKVTKTYPHITKYRGTIQNTNKNKHTNTRVKPCRQTKTKIGNISNKNIKKATIDKQTQTNTLIHTPLPPPINSSTHKHKHKHKHTQTNTQRHKHTDICIKKHKDTLIQKHTHKLIQMHTHTHISMQPYTYK